MLPPVPKPDERALLHISLVDTVNYGLTAQRALTFSPEFTQALHKAIRDQASLKWDSAAYDRHVQRMYRRYPTSDHLVKEAVAKSSHSVTH